MTIYACDECEDPAISHICLEPGRVLRDGIDVGDTVHLCEKHTPVEHDGVTPKKVLHEHITFVSQAGNAGELYCGIELKSGSFATAAQDDGEGIHGVH